MGDGQEVPKDFPKKSTTCSICGGTNAKQLGGMIHCRDCYDQQKIFPKKEQHQTITSVLCWGCGAMIEEVEEGEDNWLFCPCGTGIMKVTICTKKN